MSFKCSYYIFNFNCPNDIVRAFFFSCLSVNFCWVNITSVTLILQRSLKTRITSNVHNFCDHKNKSFSCNTVGCRLKTLCCITARWLCIIQYWIGSVQPLVLELYYSKTLHRVSNNIICHEWGNTFPIDLWWCGTQTNYNLPSSNGLIWRRLHYHHCQYYLRI